MDAKQTNLYRRAEKFLKGKYAIEQAVKLEYLMDVLVIYAENYNTDPLKYSQALRDALEALT